jgi:hypothetical protein
VSEEHKEIAKAIMRELQSEHPEQVDKLREKAIRCLEEMGEKPTPEQVGSLVMGVVVALVANIDAMMMEVIGDEDMDRMISEALDGTVDPETGALDAEAATRSVSERSVRVLRHHFPRRFSGRE